MALIIPQACVLKRPCLIAHLFDRLRTLSPTDSKQFQPYIAGHEGVDPGSQRNPYPFKQPGKEIFMNAMKAVGIVLVVIGLAGFFYRWIQFHQRHDSRQDWPDRVERERKRIRQHSAVVEPGRSGLGCRGACVWFQALLSQIASRKLIRAEPSTCARYCPPLRAIAAAWSLAWLWRWYGWPDR